MRNQAAKTIGKPRYAYSAEEVIEFRDADHTPFNKRSGEVESVLIAQIRSPLKADWVNFSVEEITTTNKDSSTKAARTATRTITFTMTRDQFESVVAHVRRTTDDFEIKKD